MVAALQPSTEATLAGLARESATLQRTVGEAVQRQLDGLSAGFGCGHHRGHRQLGLGAGTAAAGEHRPHR